jgi:hypothetical protein
MLNNEIEKELKGTKNFDPNQLKLACQTCNQDHEIRITSYKANCKKNYDS